MAKLDFILQAVTAASPWRIKGQPRGLFRTILDIGTSSTPFIYTAINPARFERLLKGQYSIL
jgi:hypothetical protein